jgi:hypothetical protein
VRACDSTPGLDNLAVCGLLLRQWELQVVPRQMQLFPWLQPLFLGVCALEGAASYILQGRCDQKCCCFCSAVLCCAAMCCAVLSPGCVLRP